MFHAKLKLSVMKEVVDLISILVPEAKFVADESGLHTKAVDPSRVSMVSIDLDKDAFEEYEASDAELGIDLEKMRETLKLGSSDESIIMDWDKDANVLVIKIGNITRKMPLIETSGMVDAKIPQLDLKSKAVVPLDELKKGVAAAKNISESITLKMSEEGFDLSSKSEDSNLANLHLPKDALIEFEVKENARSSYTLKNFSDMISAIKSPNVTIYLGNDYPLHMTFDIAGGKGKGAYLLAPRVENY
jgi:proliferating cell nuclear antigen